MIKFNRLAFSPRKAVSFSCQLYLHAAEYCLLYKSGPAFSQFALFIILFGEHSNIKIKIRLSTFEVVHDTGQN